MSRDSVMARGRSFALSGFVDHCLIERVVAVDSNPLDGKVTKQYATIYNGVCRLQASPSASGPVSVGEASLRIGSLDLQLPVVGTEGVQVDDRVTVTACTHDLSLVGAVFHLTGTHAASHKTSRRLSMQEISS